MKCDELTQIELECNMGKDINGVVHREPWKAYDIDEVDALLAKKDKEIEELKMKLVNAQLFLRLNKPEALYSNLETMGRLRHEIDVVERRERHQKYKRCLAMAMRCKDNADWWDYEQNNRLCEQRRNAESLRFKAAHSRFCYFVKWHKRWLELA